MTESIRNWEPRTSSRRIRTIDAHTGGEPLRIVVEGFPSIEGETIVEKRRYVREHADHLRQSLMWEPRGHADMYGALPVESTHPDADIGILFIHNDGYSTMCGHGVIALGTVLPEAGVPVAAASELAIETPAGVVTARPHWDENADRVRRVAFQNVPSFVYARDQRVSVPQLGEVSYDVAFGGAFYAFVEASDVEVSLDTSDYHRLVEYGLRIKRAVADDLEIVHPAEPDLSFLYGTVFTGAATGQADSRNVCVFGDGEVDRCPTGTGVSARLARRYEAGTLAQGEPFVVESITGSRFTGRILRATEYEGYEAVIPEIEGSAHVVGRNEIIIDPTDPFAEGLSLRERD